MRRRGFKKSVAFLIVSLMSFVTVAQDAASPACGAVLCLSPEQGKPPPPECFGWRSPYFMIRVFNPYYNASATAQARRMYLMTCTQARQEDINRITQDYGELFVDPVVF